MSKVELVSVTNPDRLTSINANFQKVEDALNNKVLYRNNPETEANQMLSPLDMNSERILNLAQPIDFKDAARLEDVYTLNFQNQTVIRGVWQTATAYVPFDLVRQGESTYVCIAAHTSGVFATDFNSNRWAVAAGSEQLENDLASTASGKGAGLVGFSHANTYSQGTVALALQNVINPKNAPYNAVGNNTADDSAAIVNVIPAGRSVSLSDGAYLAIPPIGTDTDDFTKDYASFTGPGVFRVRPSTYYRGTPGQQDTYAYYKVTGTGSMIFGQGFDGNGQATILPYQPTGQNVYFYPANLYGNKKGQKAIANHSTGAGGHAIEGSQGSLMVMGLNSQEMHNGAGSTNTSALALIGNVSGDTTDSHYYLNTCETLAVVGNVGRNTIGGGGIDLAGGSNIAAVGNTMTGGQAEGIWLLKSPNTNTELNRVLVASNLLYNNCNFPNDVQGEILVGDVKNNPTVTQGQDYAVIGNFTLPQNTPGTGGFNSSIAVHEKTSRVAITGNVFSGFASSVSPRAQAIRDRGAADIVYAGNVSLNKEAQVFIEKQGTGFVHYANNVNLRIAPDSVGIPTAMESSDGVWNYHIVRPLTKAGITVMDIDYPGGDTFDVIEVTVCNDGTANGIVQQRILTRGNSSATPTVLSNTSVFSVGTNPPTVTVNTSVINRLRIIATTAAGGTDNQLAAFNITIKSASDYVSRFKPVFA